ncbi:hypothetical protein WJX84_002871 [Apatococcus fuscideae]|uniref:Uncharacterized protein n=1 Tax=Apatococcus fuscideae TaxID=2026836 RepID=A0AAW1SRI2_9CHLO
MFGKRHQCEDSRTKFTQKATAQANGTGYTKANQRQHTPHPTTQNPPRPTAQGEQPRDPYNSQGRAVGRSRAGRACVGGLASDTPDTSSISEAKLNPWVVRPPGNYRSKSSKVAPRAEQQPIL